MKITLSRRRFLLGLASLPATAGLRPLLAGRPAGQQQDAELFDISLAEWSLNKSLRAGKLTNLDFPRVARREFGISAVEFVDQFFRDKARDAAYLRELKKRAEDEGVDCHLIMIDTAGRLGAADGGERKRAVESHKEWADAARALGCRTIRVNARGEGSPQELKRRIADSCEQLARYAAGLELNLVIENHGGPSSDPDWLVSVMREVGLPNFGTLPDFGNFPGSVDRYLAVERLMPFAKAVSAKAGRFDEKGREVNTDFYRMLRIVRDGGFHGYVGVESGASSAEGEAEALRKTKALLERVREYQRRLKPIFNGKDFTGWVKVHGGEWTIEDGVIIGRNGKDWAVDPERTGSWLRTEKMYSDFILELQYDISPRGNSGVFFRAKAERNPAFTGYEMQIFENPDAEPGIWSPLAICKLVTPTKTVVRPSGEWNTITIRAEGEHITITGNGEKVIDSRLDRSSRGYIGLQNHDEKAVVRFRNLRLAEL